MDTSRRGPRRIRRPLNFWRKLTAPHEKRGWMGSAVDALVTAAGLKARRTPDPAPTGYATTVRAGELDRKAPPQSAVEMDLGGAI